MTFTFLFLVFLITDVVWQRRMAKFKLTNPADAVMQIPANRGYGKNNNYSGEDRNLFLIAQNSYLHLNPTRPFVFSSCPFNLALPPFLSLKTISLIFLPIHLHSFSLATVTPT